ncbi:MAG TPA: GPR1/FUN34/YaaH family transporter [Solirubrobacteraceae bacterium]|nr:GPR1/FUN34/YaaH family transporter [Solirubrobacteraceae bacterium]
MSTTTQPARHGATNGASGELREWRDHARVFLQPIAAPSILGLYGFAVATFMVTAHQVGWYGTATSPLLIFPFATAAGGIAQGVAALWAYKARDGLATGIHGIWAAFWLGYGFLNFMVALKLVPAPAPHQAVPELGYWFYTLAAVTLVGMIASLGESLAITLVLAPLWVGVAFLGVFYTVGGSGWEKVGGYVTMASAFTAFYTASAMMLASTFGRVIFPLGKYRKEANVPGGNHTYPIQFEMGEPGVKQGQ